MRPLGNDKGFTGLEAAIVLIAFVVVAAVFSYVVLAAGFFTTQKSQEVVHTGVQQASSTIQISGNIYGTGTAGSTIDTMNFSASLAPGGTPVDFDKVAITYSNATNLETLSRGTKGQPPGSGQWTIAAVHNEATNDDVLEKGEQFDIVVKPTNSLPKNDQFTLDVKPSIGAALSITRTTPASIQKINVLY
ncbi:MAG: archaellin/type IV pilin N-terminal domain-containing protein [Methanoregula sp.]